MSDPKLRTPRLDGLDLARFLAFAGMVIVNFTVVMVPYEDATNAFSALLQGKAAASFVVLAGIGLGLGAKSGNFGTSVSLTLRRAAFLLVLGLANMTIFDADILHYYAFYFLFGVVFLAMSNRWLWCSIIAVNLIFVAMILGLDYDTGWNWDTLTYEGFWTVSGFFRNLFYNGWHPVFPWVGFLVLGIYLSRAPLSDSRYQSRMVFVGLGVVASAELASRGLIRALNDPELVDLLTTGPVPPMPLYFLAGSGAALALTGLCLKLAPRLRQLGVLQALAPAGRQTLTLYIAHILLGMGVLEALGLIESDATQSQAYWASAAFVAASAIYAWLWSKAFKRGPIEYLMRKLAG